MIRKDPIDGILEDDVRDMFVYGTLKPGHELYLNIAPFVQSSKSASTNGVLLAIPGSHWPSAIFCDQTANHEFPKIHGKLLKFYTQDIFEVLDVCDGIEGVGRGLFERVIVIVCDEEGEYHRAWAYQSCYIPDGTWSPEKDVN